MKTIFIIPLLFIVLLFLACQNFTDSDSPKEIFVPIPNSVTFSINGEDPITWFDTSGTDGEPLGFFFQSNYNKWSSYYYTLDKTKKDRLCLSVDDQSIGIHKNFRGNIQLALDGKLLYIGNTKDTTSEISILSWSKELINGTFTGTKNVQTGKSNEIITTTVQGSFNSFEH